MELKKLIEVVRHYEKNKSYHSIEGKDREFIIRLHDDIIPMDIKLFKAGSGGCDSCIRKAMSRFVQHIDILLQYTEDREPKKADTPTPTKKKRGRPRKKK